MSVITMSVEEELVYLRRQKLRLDAWNNYMLTKHPGLQRTASDFANLFGFKNYDDLIDAHKHEKECEVTNKLELCVSPYYETYFKVLEIRHEHEKNKLKNSCMGQVC